PMRTRSRSTGQNIQIEFRLAEGDEGRLQGLATELVGLNVDVIVTYATGVFAARSDVIAVGGDIVCMGIATSLSHPGGNVTGSMLFFAELMAKRLKVMKEVVPSMTRAGVLLLRGNPSNSPQLQAIGAGAKALRVELQAIEVSGPTEFESAFSAWVDNQIGAV